MLLRHGGQQGRYALRRALGRRKRHHAGHRVALVRHGGRTAASRLGRFCQLADLILAHQGNIPGDFPKAADQQAQLAPQRQPFVALGVLGARVPAQVTAAGMLLLSLRDPVRLGQWRLLHELKAYTSFTIANKERMRIELARVRAQGWALSEQQLALYYRGVAVPLRDRHGDVLGALSVTMPMGHESGEDAVRRVLSVLSETAQAMRNLI